MEQLRWGKSNPRSVGYEPTVIDRFTTPQDKYTINSFAVRLVRNQLYRKTGFGVDGHI